LNGGICGGINGGMKWCNWGTGSKDAIELAVWNQRWNQALEFADGFNRRFHR